MDVIERAQAIRAYKKKRKGMALSNREQKHFIKYMDHWLGIEIKMKIKGLFKRDE